MKKQKKVNNISWGLFLFRGGRWFRDCAIFIKRIFFTLRHGYSPVAEWETFAWFIDIMKEILTFHRYDRNGTPCAFDDSTYNELLDTMLDLLDKMDEDSVVYKNVDWSTKYNSHQAAKDEFFKLFSEHFYGFWD